jgi:hypothetical protein
MVGWLGVEIRPEGFTFAGKANADGRATQEEMPRLSAIV